jgi:hypothetical protein
VTDLRSEIEAATHTENAPRSLVDAVLPLGAIVTPTMIRDVWRLLSCARVAGYKAGHKQGIGAANMWKPIVQRSGDGL